MENFILKIDIDKLNKTISDAPKNSKYLIMNSNTMKLLFSQSGLFYDDKVGYMGLNLVNCDTLRDGIIDIR